MKPTRTPLASVLLCALAALLLAAACTSGADTTREPRDGTLADTPHTTPPWEQCPTLDAVFTSSVVRVAQDWGPQLVSSAHLTCTVHVDSESGITQQMLPNGVHAQNTWFEFNYDSPVKAATSDAYDAAIGRFEHVRVAYGAESEVTSKPVIVWAPMRGQETILVSRARTPDIHTLQDIIDAKLPVFVHNQNGPIAARLRALGIVVEEGFQGDLGGKTDLDGQYAQVAWRLSVHDAVQVASEVLPGEHVTVVQALNDIVYVDIPGYADLQNVVIVTSEFAEAQPDLLRKYVRGLRASCAVQLTASDVHQVLEQVDLLWFASLEAFQAELLPARRALNCGGTVSAEDIALLAASHGVSESEVRAMLHPIALA